LNGQLFSIRANLWDSLHKKRKEDKNSKVSYLWVDALCINPQSNKERNHQVDIMGQIHKKASKVLIWLGTGN